MDRLRGVWGRMDRSQLNTFIRVAEQGSFSKAARSLGISPQSLLEQVNRFEDKLGFTLFVRDHRGVTLTEPGMTFYKEITRLVAAIDELTMRCRIQEQGVIFMRVGQSPQLLTLLPVYDAFVRSFPGVRLQVSELSKAKNSNIEAVLDGLVDVSEAHWAEVHDLPPELVFTHLSQIKPVLLMAPNDPLARRGPVRIADLDGRRLHLPLLSEEVSLIEKLLRAVPSITVTPTFPGIAEVCNACFGGGLFLMPEGYAERFRPLASATLDIDESFVFGLIHRKRPSPIAHAFIDTALGYYGA